MFSKLALFVASAFALGVIAAPGGTPPAGSSSQCNTGTLNCCNTVQNANSTAVQNLAGLLGIALGDLTGQVGLACTAVSVIGASGNSCTSQAACCSGNEFGGVITAACNPINVNL